MKNTRLEDSYKMYLEGLSDRILNSLDLESLKTSYLRHSTYIAEGSKNFSHNQESRGFTYALHQIAEPYARILGVATILNVMQERLQTDSINSPLFLDALGGSGTVAHIAKHLLNDENRNNPIIITVDGNLDQINKAKERGLIAFPQSADKSIFNAESIDVIFFAYGFHHIHQEDRVAVFESQYKSIRPGGVLAIFEAENNSPTAAFYSPQHKYANGRSFLNDGTLYGHLCDHLDKDKIKQQLEAAGFTQLKFQYIYDPFVLIADLGKSETKALLHIAGMFSVVKFMDPSFNSEIDWHTYWKELENINELDAKVNLIRDRLDPFARITDTEEKALKTKEMEYEAYPTFLKNYYGQKIPIVSKIETISLNDGREACIIPRALMAITAIKL